MLNSSDIFIQFCSVFIRACSVSVYLLMLTKGIEREQGAIALYLDGYTIF
ncbi:hypothetical protein [Gloeocapsa sp. PCC 7428]|nr:hypothetical protein [Gloeocapsa sp. PCC 7428]